MTAKINYVISEKLKEQVLEAQKKGHDILVFFNEDDEEWQMSSMTGQEAIPYAEKNGQQYVRVDYSHTNHGHLYDEDYYTPVDQLQVYINSFKVDHFEEEGEE